MLELSLERGHIHFWRVQRKFTVDDVIVSHRMYLIEDCRDFVLQTKKNERTEFNRIENTTPRTTEKKTAAASVAEQNARNNINKLIYETENRMKIQQHWNNVIVH